MAVTQLGEATAEQILECLGKERFELFHFAGHCESTSFGGALVLKSEGRLFADQLAPGLRRAGVRLCMLASCGSRSGPVFAAELARSGFSAVIGACRGVRDRSAASFTHAIYGSLLQGHSVALAVHDARSVLSEAGEDWGAYRLFGRAEICDEPLVVTGRPKATPLRGFPVEDRPFLGRAKERSAVAGFLRRDNVHLVTILAMGGMGKTRLANAVARDVVGTFPGGVFWIDCADLRNQDDLLGAIAGVAQLEERSPTEAELAKALDGERRLLVLDCFEHLIELREVVATLSKNTNGLTILVTSRIELTPRSVTEIKFHLNTFIDEGREGLRAGISLLEQTAAEAAPSYRFERSERLLVRDLVEKLEGIPLAIVLAAGRLRMLTVEQIVGRIPDRRLEMLASSDIEERHATMLKVIEDSFKLLDEDEVALMREISVFQGGFGLEDAEQVLLHRPDCLSGLAALRENCLLATGRVEGQMRYRILDTIREYVMQTLAEFPTGPVEDAHAEHYACRAESFRRMHDEGEWKAANTELWREAANIRAAVARAMAERSAGLVARFARSMARWYLETGLRRDFDALVESAELAAAETGDADLEIELRGLVGECRRRERRFDEAISLWIDRADRARVRDNIDAVADSYTDIASLGLQTGRPELTRSMLGLIGVLDGGRISMPVRATALVIGARLNLLEGNEEEALAGADQVEQLIAASAFNRHNLFVWMSLSRLFRAVGRQPDSQRVARRLIFEASEAGHVQSIGRGVLELARTLEESGNIEGASDAVYVASLVPKAASFQVWSEARSCRLTFESRYGRDLLVAAAERGDRHDLLAHAHRLGAARSTVRSGLAPPFIESGGEPA